MNKTKWNLGDKAWRVEWCHTLPRIEGTTDTDIDSAKYSTRIVKTKAEALRVAKEVYPLDQFGAVQYWPVELQDPHEMNLRATFCWEPIGDPIEYSGDE